MTTYYAKEFVGVADGTQQPPLRADGRVVHAKKRVIRASKDNTNALASGDKLFIGTLPQGAVVKAIRAVTDTSFATATISIGTLASASKYVSTKTLTATDVPTDLGPKASAHVADPLSAPEDLYVTLGTAGVAAAVVAAFDVEYTISA